MPCAYIDMPNGGKAHLRFSARPRRKCQVCFRRWSSKLCDYPTGPGKKTCDKALCTACATSIDSETDYCPEHKDYQPQASLFATEPSY